MTASTAVAPTRMTVEERDAAYAQLTDRLAEVCGVLNVAHARLVALAAQAIEQELWQGWGIRSLEHFLCWQAGLSPSRAHHIACIARRYDELPETIEAFTKGELSVDQVATVAQRIPAEHDESAAQLARSATVTQLRRVLLRPELIDPPDVAEGVSDETSVETRQDGAVPNSAPEVGSEPALAPAQLSMGDDGTRFFLHLDAPIDEGQQIRHALTEARDRRGRRAVPRAGPTRCSTCASARWSTPPCRARVATATGFTCTATSSGPATASPAAG